MMLKRFFGHPAVSAVLGGAVVAIFGLIAINSGWVEVSQSGSGAPKAESMVADVVPAVGSDSNDQPGKSIGQIYREEGQGIAFIQAEVSEGESTTPFGFPEERGGGASTGSGFVIDQEGHVMTNHHVVDGADRIEVVLGDSDTVYEAEVVGQDPATDLALIKVDAPADALHPLQLGDSSKVQVGDPVVAIGNPFGLDRTVTSGIVSALQRQIQAPNGFAISKVIQTDAPINPGNSGGPLIDAQGRVIGINSQIQTGGLSQGNVGIGFAVPVNTARDVIEQIQETGTVEHAFLGITGVTVDSQMANALNLPVESGVLIQEVTEGGPSADAGLKGGDTSATLNGIGVQLGGDIVTAIDGDAISSMDDVISMVNDRDPGETVTLTVLRDGNEREVEVTLGTRPESARG